MAVGFVAAFAVWTVLVRTVDVAPIGPRGSVVGVSTLNEWFHSLTGVNMFLYTITDWLGLLTIGVALGFAVLGIVQSIKRKSLWRVDRSILLLGGFYLAVIAVYVFFEVFAVNYRPVLIEGALEVSYPSSTTMLAMCVIPTAMMQLRDRIRRKAIERVMRMILAGLLLVMVIGRLLSGVHWVTDIVGGVLISLGLVMMYRGLVYGKM